MEQITKLSIHSLKIHPRNTEFFDDIEGEMYQQFKQSIQEDGVLTPIIVSPDMTIVSGHQRYIACKELGIELIPAIIREELINEDLMLRQLIASNFGRLSNNPSKFRKAVAEYVDLVGKKLGDNQWVSQDDKPKLTQSEIAKELGISVAELNRVLDLERKLIPELKQALDKGFISKTAALGICSKLNESEQQELLTDLTKLIATKTENKEFNKASASNKEIEELTNKIKELQETNNKLVEKNTELMTVQYEKQQLEESIEDLKFQLENIKPQDKPETLAKIQRLKDREKLLEEKIELIEKDVGKYRELKNQIETLTMQKDDIGRQIESATSLSGYIVEIEEFLKNKLAPVKYSRALLEMKDNPAVIRNVTDIVQCVELWCAEIRKYIPKENNYVIYEREDM
jgi:ParB-like chromosome segregation protein Spo0J